MVISWSWAPWRHHWITSRDTLEDFPNDLQERPINCKATPVQVNESGTLPSEMVQLYEIVVIRAELAISAIRAVACRWPIAPI